MQIVRHAKFFGTMIGPDGHIHRWTAPRKKFIQRVLKINASTKSLVERLCDFKIYAISVLSFIGSVCAPDKATLKTEKQCPAVYNCRTVQRKTFLELALYVVLVLTWWVFTPSALRLAIELLHVRPRLAKALRKSNRLVGTTSAPIFALSLAWEKEFLAPSMACSTANAFDIVCRQDCDGKLDEAPQNKKHNVASGLLRDKFYEQDFAGPISLRASKVLGPISRSPSCGHPATT